MKKVEFGNFRHENLLLLGESETVCNVFFLIKRVSVYSSWNRGPQGFRRHCQGVQKHWDRVRGQRHFPYNFHIGVRKSQIPRPCQCL